MNASEDGKRRRLDEGTMCPRRLVTLGETMLRYEPIDTQAPVSRTRHLPQAFLRSLGGDELNVSVALSLLGIKTRWVSVLPIGPMGDIVLESCKDSGVEFAGTMIEGDIGTYTMLPEDKKVHFQRRNSTFALHCPTMLEWDKLLPAKEPEWTKAWLHVTGITPLISSACLQSWRAAIEHAIAMGVPISLDLNHRKQLGTLKELHDMVANYFHAFEVVVLSVEQLLELADLLALASKADEPDDVMCFKRMQVLHERWQCKRVVVCRKARDTAGVQRRWSLMTCREEQSGSITEHSTYSRPVWHKPKDDCGGGSAWMAGFLHAIFFAPMKTTGELAVLAALRRADLLSALCQETKGDQSTVTCAELAAVEERFGLTEAHLYLAPGSGALLQPSLTRAEAELQVERTLALLKKAKVLAILRAKGSPDIAAQRALELQRMGCQAIEITMDSKDWALTLRRMRELLPPGYPLGVGTVMDDTVSELGRAASLGASFALSPIDPIGFVEECHRRGMLAIPSAFTSNECWQLHRRGVRLIKLFHASTISPAILKSMLDVTPLGENLNILPSGGVSPSNAAAWWDAGSPVVGMGSNLVGKDISFEPGTPAYAAAAEEWKSSGAAVARKLFEEAGRRSLSSSSA